jgi:mono/diheme cytochrome c family protein
VFYTTINNGRMDKGMPVWKGVLSEDMMWKIFTFLSSVQTQP